MPLSECHSEGRASIMDELSWSFGVRPVGQKISIYHKVTFDP